MNALRFTRLRNGARALARFGLHREKTPNESCATSGGTGKRRERRAPFMPAHSGFTMIEIAIALAVIAFALVAIIGVLPTGINVQKDNREDTIVNQDAPYWLEAIRNGAKGLDYLTNFVETITISNTAISNTVREFTIFTNAPNPPPPMPPLDGSMTNGRRIVGLLTIPKYQLRTNIVVTNYIVAKVRALTGSATEQGTANPDFAFSYYMTVETTPYTSQPIASNSINSAFGTNFALGTNPLHTAQLKANWTEARTRQANLSEARLTFRWPLITGPNRSSVRAIIGGGRTNEFDFSFFKPQTFIPVQAP